jgi:hypothetical protein
MAHLVEFYHRAEELGRLDAVLQLSLSRKEEEEFVRYRHVLFKLLFPLFFVPVGSKEICIICRFLQDSKRPDSQEVLLMYYLQRSRFKN